MDGSHISRGAMMIQLLSGRSGLEGVRGPLGSSGLHETLMDGIFLSELKFAENIQQSRGIISKENFT